MADSRIPYLDWDYDVEFPDPRSIQGDIVASEGNLSPGMLLSAYRRGIFPWYSQGEPILWWSLDPRFIIPPSRIHVSRSLKKFLRKCPFQLTLDCRFHDVITACAESDRPDQDGTWITDEMIEGYEELHRLGFAHSVEAWLDDELAGGLYGVSLGGCFYGESMFARVSEASKTAFVALAGTLIDADFGLIDCQQQTSHLRSFGAVDMPRNQFLDTLAAELEKPTIRGHWGRTFPSFPDSALWRTMHKTNAEAVGSS